MAKIYIALMGADEKVSGCVLDLDVLPPGASSSVVSHPWTQGVEVAAFAKDDVARLSRIIAAIGQGTWGTEAVSFVTAVGSLWENLPPADEEKDGLLTVLAPKDRADFVRTSPQVALSTWRQLLTLVQ